MSLSCICDRPLGGEKLHWWTSFRLLFLILSSGFILRVGWLFYARPMPVSDFRVYKQLAENLLDLHHFGFSQPTAYYMPGLSFFLAGCMSVSRTDVWLGFVNICVTILICAEVYFLSRRLISARAGLWASLVCVLNPAYIYYSPVLTPDHLFGFLLLGSILLALPSHRRGFVRIILSGVFLGLAILTRGEGLFYVPVVLAISYWPARSDPAAGVRVRSCFRFIAAIVAMMCVLLPWYIRNIYVVGAGAGLATSGGVNFYFAHNPNRYGYQQLPQSTSGLDEIAKQNQLYRLGWEHIRSHPGSLLGSTLLGTVRLYAPSTYGINWSSRLPAAEPGGDWRTQSLGGLKVFRVSVFVGYALLLLGIILAPVTRRYWTGLNIFVIAGIIFSNWLCFAVIFYAKPRYHYLVETFFCVIAGTVIARFMSRRSASSGSTQ